MPQVVSDSCGRGTAQVVSSACGRDAAGGVELFWRDGAGGVERLWKEIQRLIRRNIMKIYNNITELIGNTPIVRLYGIEKKYGLDAEILAKLEYFNPAGSVKDRVALAMLDKAEKDGVITSSTVIIEPTSGNTGIGIAMVCAARGYKAVIVMPDTMSIERQKLLAAYGAEVVLTDGKLGMAGAIEKANALKNEIGDAFIAGQFENSANPQAHIRSTAPEIWQATGGKLDILTAGVGTGGTVSGIGRYLKDKNPDIKVVAVEPHSSAVLSGAEKGAHKIQGIGAGFVPKTLDTSVYDEVITVTDDEAYEMARNLVKTDAILAGISSAAAVVSAVKLAKRAENSGKTILAILPDSGERYLSCDVF